MDARAVIDQAFRLYETTFEPGGAPKANAPDPKATETMRAARNPSKQARLEAARRAADHNATRNPQPTTDAEHDHAHIEHHTEDHLL